MYLMNYRKPRHKSMDVTLNAASRDHHGGPGVKLGLKLDNVRSSLYRTSFGYRKYTTGEYVSTAYRRHFGWKNTYYQCSMTEVYLGLADAVVLGVICVGSLDADAIDAYEETWRAACKEASARRVLPDYPWKHLMFSRLWSSRNAVEDAAALVLSKDKDERELARAVLEHKIVIN